MKISRNWWIAIVVILVLVVGFGVKKHMDNETIKHNVIVNEQEIAKELISEYSGIKEIKFIRVSEISDTGGSQYQFKINNNDVKLGYDDYGRGIPDGNIANGSNDLEKSPLSSKMKREHKIKTSDIDLNKYKIIYYTVVD